MQKKKVDRRVVRTKKVMKDSLISLLYEKDLSLITITDIVDRSDVNRSTFYAHFQDKEDFIDCLIDELIQGLIDTFQHTSVEDKNVDSFPYRFTIEAMFTYIYINSNYFKVLLLTTKVPRFTPELYTRLYKYSLSHIKKLSETETKLDVHIGLYANYLSSTFISFVHYWLVDREQKYSPEYISNEFIKVILSNPLATYIKESTSDL